MQDNSTSKMNKNNHRFVKFLETYRAGKAYPYTSTIIRILMLIGLLYLFMLSITLMGASFKLFGKDFAKELIATTSNPLVGLVIGVLATSVIQSSSTTTSIVVGLVGAGALTIHNAIPIIMGANIGTSVTNTIVSLGHISIKEEFERAFSASIVHDFFNIIAVILIFPLQYFTNFLEHASGFLAGVFQNIGGLEAVSPIKVITEPAVKIILGITGQSGVICLILSLVLLFLSLRYLVKVIKSLIIGKVEKFFDKVLFRNAFISLFFGFALTSICQSSSITTSLIVPLVGAGILTLEQIFPYTMGANIGTTMTSMLAALAAGNIAAIQVAFAHLCFNLIGVTIIFQVQFIPIKMARLMAKLTLKSKLYPVLYILIMFFIFPLLIIYFLR